jgi:hypothetical protein
MSKTTRGTPFWNKPGKDIAPGDVFPALVLPAAIPPISTLKKSGLNLPAKHAQQHLWERHALDPVDPPPEILDPSGMEIACRGRMSFAMFLTWGSDIDADLSALAGGKKPAGRVWLAAPVENMEKLSADKKYMQPNGEQLSDRDVVKMNANHNRFYLPPFPSASGEHLGRYVDFKKIAPAGIQAFIQLKHNRAASLTNDALNDMFHHLCWHFTRAEIFFHAITCVHCGGETPLDIRFSGQEIEDNPL